MNSDRERELFVKICSSMAKLPWGFPKLTRGFRSEDFNAGLKGNEDLRRLSQPLKVYRRFRGVDIIGQQNFRIVSWISTYMNRYFDHIDQVKQNQFEISLCFCIGDYPTKIARNIALNLAGEAEWGSWVG